MANRPVSMFILQADTGYYPMPLTPDTTVTITAASVTVNDPSQTFVFPVADTETSVLGEGVLGEMVLGQ